MKHSAISQTPQAQKVSLMERLKNLFGDTKSDASYETVNVMNDASFHVPMSQRASSKPNLDRLNQTMPAARKPQFSIDDDDLPEPVPQPPPKQEERKTPTVPSDFLRLQGEGYEEIDIKPLNSSRLVEKDPYKEPYAKGSVISFPPSSTLKITKVPKVYDSLFDYLVGTVSREIAIDGGWVYVMKKQGKDQFKVCSATKLDRLFKIIIKKSERKPPIKLAFINRHNNVYQMPQVKEFTLINKDQQDMFFIKLRSEVQKHGLDLLFRK